MYLLAILDIFEANDVFYTNLLMAKEGDQLLNQNLLILILRIGAKYHVEYYVEAKEDSKMRRSL